MIPRPEVKATITGHETAAALGISYSTLMRAVSENRSPVAFVKVGARVVFVTADLRRVLQLDGPEAA
jgi:hypothetical protein